MSEPRATADARPFGIADGMILVAAVAAGAAVNRAFPWPYPPSWQYLSGFPRAAYWTILPHLWSLAVAGLVLQWRGRVPAGQPGFLACAAATTGLILTSLQAAILAGLGRSGIAIDLMMYSTLRWEPNGTIITGTGRGQQLAGLWQAIFLSEGNLSGYLVLGAWLAVRLGGRWGRTDGGRERLGRAIGWGWLVIAAYRWMFFLSL